MDSDSDGSEDDSSRSVVIEDPDTALKVLARGFGEYHWRFVESSVSNGALALVALVDGSPAGAVAGFNVASVGVIYYVYVEERFRGAGVGKSLVLSMEELLEERGARAFVASTTRWNTVSMRLFDSLGYQVIPIERFRRRDSAAAWKTEKLACMEDDDVVMAKPSVSSLARALAGIDSREVRKVWVSQCLKPWLGMVFGERGELSLKALSHPRAREV